MKKTTQKPENWQDFEILCKKLWGEIWNIPMKIKRNGRNGQPQAGVDIYGVPKNEVNYWGIQCKGKDDYTDAKLTKIEIDREIAKAKLFMPKLSVFIFATTMNKNSDIEEYIRLKDLESRQNNEFEILLFCWEDIADLIDENQDTYNFWVANKLHKTKFDFSVYLNDFELEYTIQPRCIRTIKRYRIKETIIEPTNNSIYNFKNLSAIFERSSLFLNRTQGKINEALCPFELIMVNEGSNVIEDWKIQFTILGDYIDIIDIIGTGIMGMIDFNAIKHKSTYIENNTILFVPNNNKPLIQKDNRNFELYIIPKYQTYKIPIEWKLLARDFDSTGIIYLNVIPKYEDKYEYEDVNSETELKEDEVISIIAKKNYEDDENI